MPCIPDHPTPAVTSLPLPRIDRRILRQAAAFALTLIILACAAVLALFIGSIGATAWSNLFITLDQADAWRAM